VASQQGWRVGGAVTQFQLAENFFLVGKFYAKNAKIWGWKFLTVGEIATKLKFCAPIIVSVRNLELSA